MPMPSHRNAKAAASAQGRRESASNERQAAASDLINDAGQVADLAAHLARQPLIAFDTEFIRERTFFAELGLLQLADRRQVWLLDPLAFNTAQLQPLLDVLTSPDVVKVAHAVEQDQECLYHAYGIVASPVLDTAIAAALTGQGDQIGLSSLLQKLLRIRLPKGHTRTNWLKRPLPSAMAEYARADVEHLVEAAEMLLADLDRRGRRGWAFDLSAELSDPARYLPNPEATAKRLASTKRLDAVEYAVLRELVRWREDQVRQTNVPRSWLADDQVLVRLACARPKTEEDLSHFRGLGARARKLDRAGLLAAIQEGIKSPTLDSPRPPRRREPEAREGPALAVLKCFVGLLAQEHEVPVRFLIESDAWLGLLRGRFATVAELHQSGLLRTGALHLFGEETLAVLHGRRALRLVNGRAERFKFEA